MLHVKPAAVRLVRHPETGEILPVEGMAVPRNTYWLRRVKDGDVLECTPPKAKKEPANKEGAGVNHGNIV